MSSTTPLTLVIMAAGLGSRYGGEKQIEEFGPDGAWLMDYALYDAYAAGFRRAVLITREPLLPLLQSALTQRWGDCFGFEFVIQPSLNRTKPWGTTHAILCAQAQVHTPFAVINADDYYGKAAFVSLARFLSAHPPHSTEWALVGYRLGDTLSPSGQVSRGVCAQDQNGTLLAIREHTALERRNQHIEDLETGAQLPENSPVSMNCWGFTPAVFEPLKQAWKRFYDAHQHDPKAEWHLPHFIGTLLKNKNASVKVLTGGENWMGVTYHEDKKRVQAQLKALHRQGLYPPKLAVKP